MRVLDYTRVDFDLPSVVPDTRRGYFAVGTDEGRPVVGEVALADGRPHFVAKPVDVITADLERFADGGWAGDKANSLRLDGRTRLRGDRVNAALHDLAKPASMLRPGDAVMVSQSEAEGLGRIDLRVQDCEGHVAGGHSRFLIEGQWYDRHGHGPDGSTFESTTTLAGDQPYGSQNQRLDAQLYLLHDTVEQWNPHSKQMAPQIQQWGKRLDDAGLDIREVELSAVDGPTQLRNSASDLNLIAGKLDDWMVQTGCRFAPARQPSPEHAARVAETRARASDLDEPGPDVGPEL